MDYFQRLKSASKTSAEVESDRRRMGQTPAINQAQKAAETAQGRADAAFSLIPIGAMVAYGGTGDPSANWLLCDGRVLQRIDYPALFNAIGTAFNLGFEAAEDFRIPDTKSRTLVGAGQGTGLTSRVRGSRFGTENHTLGITEIPSHAHDGFTGSTSHDHGGATLSYAHAHNSATSVDGHGHPGGVTNLSSHDHGTISGTGNHEHTESRVTSLQRTPINLADGTAHDALNGVTSSNGSTSGGGAHTHQTTINSHGHNLEVAASNHGHSIAQDNHSHGVNTNSHAHGIAASGGSQSHNNIQPSLAVNYIIRCN